MERPASDDLSQPESALRALVALDCWSDRGSQPFEPGAFAWSPALAPAEGRLLRLVRALEEEVIPRLVQAHRAMPVAAQPYPALVPPMRPADVPHFVRLVLAPDDAPMFAQVSALVAAGVSIESIYLDLLSPAAQRLGVMWETDEADFSDVTVGVGRLQQLLRELSPAFGAEVEHPVEGRRALLVPAPGEQHTFGLSMVSEFFRRAGWEVTGGIGGSRTDAIDAVRREWFDVIGFSVGSEIRLDWLCTGISAVRESSRNRSIGVLVGGPVFKLHPEYVTQVGADATAADGLQAPVIAESLVAQRTRHP